MWLAQGLSALKKLFLEHGSHAFSAAAASANEPNPARRKTLDHGDGNLFLEATGDHVAFAQGDKKGAVHGLAFRFAAARASRALE
jgi:hypothetical protein